MSGHGQVMGEGIMDDRGGTIIMVSISKSIKKQCIPKLLKNLI